MILLERPFVSDFLKSTIKKHQIPVVQTPYAVETLSALYSNFVPVEEVIQRFKSNPNTTLYTNSENALSWVKQHLESADCARWNSLFKNKYAFRVALKEMYSEFYFEQISFQEAKTVDPTTFRYPFILKPTIGFYSLGVKKVNTEEEYFQALTFIEAQVEQVAEEYPAVVFDAKHLILEECIEGTEYAFDAYYDDKGDAVVLNVLEHLFADENDVSDRVYISSKAIIDRTLASIEAFLKELGELLQLKNYPLHIEIRIDDHGQLQPIEINPMRFGGFCTTADHAHYCYGFNSYLAYQRKERPNWEQIFKGKEDQILSVILIDNVTNIPNQDIYKFDYERLLTKLEKPLHLRKMDWLKFPMFAFFFASTQNDKLEELQYFLEGGFQEFMLSED